MQFQGQTAAWSPCQKGPAQTMFCSGTFTITLGSAGHLCMGAVEATKTNSPQDKSARVGVRWRKKVAYQSHYEIYIVTAYPINKKSCFK